MTDLLARDDRASTESVGESQSVWRQNLKAPAVLKVIRDLANRLVITSTATVGRSVQLTVLTLRYLVTDSVRLRLPMGETLTQAWSLLTVTVFPAVLMAIPFGAIITMQAGGILHDVGASSLAGAASGLGIVRQGAPMASGLLMAGAAASAIASDLGTRAIREEIDAMRVMGVDPVQRLVVPRLVAMLAIAPVILATIILVGVGSAFFIAVRLTDVSPGSFWASFGAFATVTDLMFALVKTLVAAALVAVIASLRGLEAHGGPRGVADAVNAAVVLSVVTFVFAALVLTQLQTMFFPEQFA
ncbi:ABC transporter [Mycobacteroides abscessus subsp. bolletii]|nr:ABC transporter [Mycobacteroides abscessus subsp. bolletii]SHW22277.1 ABC transporter [Mycobacteroides abscessus subsp. bolletii]SHW47218.1 ABC transporter [Mycobacteroides abscessus subsp. bolletii]SHX91697.1 ABC transporter [Mycobacteroides abscessus subsp. bolletii]SKS69381.1 ABC transporter [Mycobacteroides abscessus subsp. bolletii]